MYTATEAQLQLLGHTLFWKKSLQEYRYMANPLGRSHREQHLREPSPDQNRLHIDMSGSCPRPYHERSSATVEGLTRNLGVGVSRSRIRQKVSAMFGGGEPEPYSLPASSVSSVKGSNPDLVVPDRETSSLERDSTPAKPKVTPIAQNMDGEDEEDDSLGTRTEAVASAHNSLLTKFSLWPRWT